MKTQRFIAHSAASAAFLLALYSCSNRQAPGGASDATSGGVMQAANNNTSGGLGNTQAGNAAGTTQGTASTTVGGVGGAPAGAVTTAAGSPTSTGAGGTEVVLTTNGTTGGVDVEMVSCGDEVLADPYAPGYQISAEATQQAQTTLSQMSTTDKANQMRGTPHGMYDNFDDIFRTLDDTNNNVKGFLFRDGPRGANLDAPFVDSSGSYIGATATAFPVSIARGAAFDIDLEYRIGVAIGDETLASRNTMQLAPTVNALRHPAWGRAQETYGEDPFHLGRLGAAFTVGVQQFIPTCVKHYLGNNVEGGRESFDAQMDPQTMREIYGYAYEMIIREAGVACVMAAYNFVNGTKSSENQELLTQILRNEWGFQGVVLTDWWAMPGNRTDSQEEALDAVGAGLDMELPWSLNYSHLETLVDSGQISEADLDASARRILEQKYRFNVATMSGQPGLRAPTTSFNGSGITGNDAHIELAYEAALKGMVLLKNENNTLPITGATNVAVLGRTVAYIGNEQSGVGGGMINFATGVITGDSGSSRVVHDRSREISPATGVEMAGGVSVTTGTSAAEAANADFVVVVVGRTPNDEGEEYTGAQEPSGNFMLDGGNANGEQNTLVQEAAALGKPMVVVMIGGSVVDMPWLDSVPAVVMAWYPGMVGGRALGDLLFGKANFTGKLPFTWPASWDQEPTFTSGSSASMGYDHGYRHFDRNGLVPLYPFGHGLSYTSFSYDQVQLGCTDVTAGGVLPVHVDVSNSGSATGDETIFVFTSYAASSRTTMNPAPIKELKGFKRVTLEPGQAKRVTIPVRLADLKYWDTMTNSWQVERGTLNIQVGPNAGNLPLMASVPVL